MPQIPTRRDLGQLKINGRANPADINPSVALDIGRAGAAYKHAFDTIGAAFAGLGAKQEAMADANWLSEAKIASLTADDAIRRDTELNAGPDGTGYEQAPLRLDQSTKEIEAKPGGSPEARQNFKLWSAQQHFQTGRWAADNAQKRLKDFTGDQLDKRLTDLTNLSSSNPDKADEYFRAYEDEVNSRVGSAISATDGQTRVDQARTSILKSATISKAIKNPADFGRAVKAIEGGAAEQTAASQAFEADNPETRARPMSQARPAGREPASVSYELETGKKDPLQGLRNISKDAGGTKSYGNFGINSGGSAQQFAAQYGKDFGLTAKPGTAEFDKQWKNAAAAAPVELHDAELKWWDDTIGKKVTNNLVRAGVTSDVANDPRVVAYFADRSVQQGPGSIANHASRVASAFKASKGDVGTFLSQMGKGDRDNLARDFPTALGDGTYSTRGNEARVSGRERLAMEAGAGAPVALPPRSEGERSGIDHAKIAPLAGSSIQPSELLSLSPRDYHEVVREVRPHLETMAEDKMNQAKSQIAAKGTQNVITPQELDDMSPILGPKKVAAWKESLSVGEQMFAVNTEVKAMTPEQRYAKLTELVPTGNVGDLAEVEQRRFEMYARSIQEIKTQIKKDPYSYFTVQNEGGRQAAKLLAGASPGAEGTPQREQAFDTLIRLQRQEGIPPSEVKILAPNTAQAITTQLGEAKTGPAALQIINGLRQTYGKHFDQLWGEMVETGAPQTYLTLRTATRAGQDALVQSYALEKAMDDSGSKAGRKGFLLERSGVKPAELNTAVANEISQFTNALAHKSGSLRAIESYRSATERVALYNVISKGMDVNTAASTAANDIFKANLKVMNGVAIPTDVYNKLGSQIDRAMNEDAGELIGPHEEQIIGPIRSSGGAYTPGYEHGRYLESIKTHPQFVTKEDASGVYLLDQAGDYVLVDTPDGPQPLSWSWEDLIKSKQPYGFRQPFMFN